MKPARVLVLGDDTRSFLTVVRSLGRIGLKVDVVPQDYASFALRSRYIDRIHRLPLFELDQEAWLAAFASLCDEIRPDFVVPCDDRTILPLHHLRARLPNVRVGLPNPEALTLFYDKHETRELALNSDVPTASGHVLKDTDEARKIVDALGLPIYIKPRRSYQLRTLSQRNGVDVCRDVNAAAAALAKLDDPAEYLVEGHLPGVGVGVSVLARNGRVSQIFQHRRLGELSSGGSSSYRRSERLDPELERMTRALCSESRLDGVAMFEYRVDDASGRQALVEVNARCWGSMPLATASGVDFPRYWYDQEVNDRIHAQAEYRVPYFARNLHGDIFELLKRLSELRSSGPGAVLRELTLWFASFGRLLVGRESHDAFAWDDIGPAIAEYRSLLDLVAQKIGRRLPGAGARERKHAHRTVAAALQTARAEQRPLEILVLCYGNICRSPYAARSLADALTDLEYPVSIQEAGLHPVSGRTSPDTARAVARTRGHSLDGHRSAYATDTCIESADLILLFDTSNRLLLGSRGLPTKAPPIRLAALLDKGSLEIADPYGLDETAFHEAYAAIEHACAALVGILKAAS